jgi:hypothetical protein
VLELKKKTESRVHLKYFRPACAHTMPLTLSSRRIKYWAGSLDYSFLPFLSWLSWLVHLRKENKQFMIFLFFDKCVSFEV